MGIKVTYPLGAGRSSEPSTLSHTWTKHWHWGIIHWAVGISEWPPELLIFPQSATGGRWNHPPRPVRTLRHSPWWFSWNTESEFFLQAWNPDFCMKPEKKRYWSQSDGLFLVRSEVGYQKTNETRRETAAEGYGPFHSCQLGVRISVM